jgi:DNA-binding MarR family transcriptional regulator
MYPGRRARNRYGEEVAYDDESRATASATDGLMELSRFMTAVVAHTLAEVNNILSVPQLRILVMLFYDSPLNLTTIAGRLGVDRSNASRPTDKLVASGLVRRTDDEDDRRNARLSLTPKGRRLVDSVLDSRRDIFTQIVEKLDPDDRVRLASCLTALLEVVDRGDAGPEGLSSASLFPWIR